MNKRYMDFVPVSSAPHVRGGKISVAQNPAKQKTTLETKTGPNRTPSNASLRALPSIPTHEEKIIRREKRVLLTRKTAASPVILPAKSAKRPSATSKKSLKSSKLSNSPQNPSLAPKKPRAAASKKSPASHSVNDVIRRKTPASAPRTKNAPQTSQKVVKTVPPAAPQKPSSESRSLRSGFVIEDASNLARESASSRTKDKKIASASTGKIAESSRKTEGLAPGSTWSAEKTSPSDELETAVSAIFSPRPSSPFIKAEVKKRPLSGSTYEKTIVTERIEESAVSPVRIVEKDPKESHSGLVIAIILTVLLGAAAGTIAFMVIPR